MVRVLIVEDSAEDLAIYKKILNQSDSVIITYAFSGEEALDLIDHNKFDIFFLDIDLPGMDGFELARKIRQNPQYILSYIIFVTGYSENQLDVFKEFHCYDYLVKPFSIDDFQSKLQLFLEQVARETNMKKSADIKTKMVLFSTSNGDCLINANDIIFAETYRNNCLLHTDKDVYRLVGVSLKDVIDQINDEYFIRCHKSFAVNIQKIAFIRQINYRLRQISFENNDKIVDLSNMFYETIMSKYQELSEHREVGELS